MTIAKKKAPKPEPKVEAPVLKYDETNDPAIFGKDYKPKK